MIRGHCLFVANLVAIAERFAGGEFRCSTITVGTTGFVTISAKTRRSTKQCFLTAIGTTGRTGAGFPFLPSPVFLAVTRVTNRRCS